MKFQGCYRQEPWFVHFFHVRKPFLQLFTAPSPISTIFSVLMSRCSLSASKKKPFGGPLSVHIELGFPCQFLYGSGSLHSPSIMWSDLKVFASTGLVVWAYNPGFLAEAGRSQVQGLLGYRSSRPARAT